MIEIRRNLQSEAGFTLVETLVAMVIFSIGFLSIAQVQFRSSQSNVRSMKVSAATMLATDILEQAKNMPQFSAITEANFPDEDYGDINNSDARYKNYKRTITIVDKLDVAGRVAMKTITVRVDWPVGGQERNVELSTRVARY